MFSCSGSLEEARSVSVFCGWISMAWSLLLWGIRQSPLRYLLTSQHPLWLYEYEGPLHPLLTQPQRGPKWHKSQQSGFSRRFCLYFSAVLRNAGRASCRQGKYSIEPLPDPLSRASWLTGRVGDEAVEKVTLGETQSGPLGRATKL